MLKTDRFKAREQQLSKALHPWRMKSLWNKHVRATLRDQPVKDLHDYYDFHFNLDNRINAIRSAIFQGIYQPRRPMRVRSEKAFGISRQLVILNPEDALVFETLGDYIMPFVDSAQPSSKAYFSRNRPGPPSPADFDENFGYPWWILWPEFQNQIMDFSRNHTYTIVTDVANYYDGIDYGQLRNYISGIGGFSEMLLDFLFFLLERFNWRPDYLPLSGKGLPQINLDAPRLVAHAFLFEIDRLLERGTNGDFVRWMDDIDFGCDSQLDAKRLLMQIDELLLSRGLHLNPAKTKILTASQAYDYFELRENQFLTLFDKRLKRLIGKHSNLSHPSIVQMKKLLRKRYSNFINGLQQQGLWLKVMKRYFNIASRMRDPFLQKSVPSYLRTNADLRQTIFRYYISLGWTADRERHLIEYLFDAMDDESFFGAIDVLIRWVPQSNIRYTQRMRDLAERLIEGSSDVSHFLGSLWILAKFGNEQQIVTYTRRTIGIWRTNDWLARQIASLWPRILREEARNDITNAIHTFGLTSAKEVIDSYEIIASSDTLFTRKVEPYVLATMGDGHYPLPKLLIALSVFMGSLSDSLKNQIYAELLLVVHDPIYRLHLKRAFSA